VDGQLQNTRSDVTAVWNSGGALQVGGMTNRMFLSGDLDQVRVFAGAMSAREVANLYAGT
jgi:hypothetical protein